MEDRGSRRFGVEDPRHSLSVSDLPAGRIDILCRMRNLPVALLYVKLARFAVVVEGDVYSGVVRVELPREAASVVVRVLDLA